MRVLQRCNRPGKQLSIWKAILVGQVVVNLPAVGIMFAALFLGSIVVPWELSRFLVQYSPGSGGHVQFSAGEIGRSTEDLLPIDSKSSLSGRVCVGPTVHCSGKLSLLE